jgi:hypothetical protein
MEAAMAEVDRRVLIMGAAAAGATLAARPAAAQDFLPDFQQTLQLVSDPISAARLELDFWLFAPLVVEALYQTGELPEKDVPANKSQMFADGLYPRTLFSALSGAKAQGAIASEMEATGELPFEDQVPAGVQALAKRKIWVIGLICRLV